MTEMERSHFMHLDPVIGNSGVKTLYAFEGLKINILRIWGERDCEI